MNREVLRDERPGSLPLPSDTTVKSVIFGSLAFCLLAVLFIDVLDVAGLRAYVGRESGLTLWHNLFKEGSLVEWIQALSLLAIVFLAGVGVSRSTYGGDRRIGALLAFLALGCSLMVIEDSGNASRTIATYAESLLGLPRAAVRMPIFAVIASIMLYGPWRYLSALKRQPLAMRAFIFGYGFYGLMVLGEVLNQLFPFYVRVGGFLTERIFAGRMVTIELPPETTAELGLNATEANAFFLMDYVYEESLELVGAAFLLLGVLRLLRSTSPTPHPQQPHRARSEATSTAVENGTAVPRPD